jgi:diguanylate cyclase (GGDEF)-like protein
VILPITEKMVEEGQGTSGGGDRHFACTLSSVLLRRVRRLCGDEALSELLERAGSTRTIEYLDDLTNWISFDEAMALFAAAAELTGDGQIGRRAGEETIAQHTGTPVATLMRSLGSPEEIYRQITQAASKFSTVSVLEAVDVAPGRAVIRAYECAGFPRPIAHCDWAKGLLSQPTVLFGLPPATVEESECQARGAEACIYHVTWDAGLAAKYADPAEHITELESRLSAMTERLDSVYATATDLIADTDIDAVLARITERAATAVRAPRYLLALRTDEDSGVRCHHSGFEADEARRLARRLLDSPVEELPDSWLVADVSSHRHRYGRLMAMSGTSFFAQERYLLELYARYAATALDGATALAEAQRGHEEARALLELARSLAAASTSDEVSRRLADAVPAVVDCDRASVWIWDDETEQLTCRAATGDVSPELFHLRLTPGESPMLAERLSDPNPAPLFVDRRSDDPVVKALLERFGGVALIVAPIVGRGDYLGALAITVTTDPSRLQPRRELLDRVSGVVAQAASALQTARLVDKVTHQATHDGLTGLANRAVFTERMEEALSAAEQSGVPVGLFFVDLDDFKSINDEYGHHAGDQLLCEVADRLGTTVRADDTVARVGGDEFAIVLSRVESQHEVEAAAQRVARAFEEPFTVAGEQLALGASVGHAVWPEDASEVEALMRHADAEMYRAKRAARLPYDPADGESRRDAVPGVWGAAG